MSDLMYDRVLSLCDGKLTQAEVAERVGCSYPYVSMVLKRNAARGGPVRSVLTLKRGPKMAPDAPLVPSMRPVVSLDGPTYRRIRDHAEAVGLSFSEVAGRLLAGAVDAGDLDALFPGERAA